MDSGGITEIKIVSLEKLQCLHQEFRNRVDKVDCYLGNGIFHGADRVRCVFTLLIFRKSRRRGGIGARGRALGCYFEKKLSHYVLSKNARKKIGIARDKA